jgi:hypothetical protein
MCEGVLQRATEDVARHCAVRTEKRIWPGKPGGLEHHAEHAFYACRIAKTVTYSKKCLRLRHVCVSLFSQMRDMHAIMTRVTSLMTCVKSLVFTEDTSCTTLTESLSGVTLRKFPRETPINTSE